VVSTFPQGVETTALFTAYARLQETRSADPLFVDKAARHFVAEALKATIADGGTLPRLGPARDDGTSAFWNDAHRYFAGRTPFYDRHVLEAIAAGCRQVVLLGAGLDARPFRLDLHSDTAVYEVDTPPVLRFKQDVLDRYGLKPAGVRVPVEVDLRDDWSSALTTAGFSPAEPAAWVAEGLIMYLAPGDAKSLFAGITQMSAPGSTVAGEILNRPFRPDDSPVGDAEDKAVAEAFATANASGFFGEPEILLPAPDWTCRGYDFTEELTMLDRPIPTIYDPNRADPLRLQLFTATRSAT
jgi:methyltransferase (TIGR00027 family)